MAADRQAVVVLAGVIERGDRVLVTRRLENTHLSGYWEFPGGKCDPGETHEDCLARELREELNVSAEIGEEILATEHAYPERTVRIHFRRCVIHGDPEPMLGQDMQWVTRAALATLAFPEADRELIEMLGKGQRPKL